MSSEVSDLAIQISRTIKINVNIKVFLQYSETSGEGC